MKILLFIEILIIVIRFDELSISLIVKFIFNILLHLIKKCNI